MTKNNSVFSELYAEMGIKTSTLIWLGILNTLRAISIFIFVVLAIAWIITQDHSFGWALIWPAAVVIVSSVIGFVVGARMVLK